jgi:hypothetical protein
VPHLSAKTIDRTSVIECLDRTPAQDSLRDSSPTVAAASETARAGAAGRVVHRFSAVAYFRMINKGSSAVPGT